ncbi:ATP-binding protein, partial [Phycicoccus sp. Root563]|uniref:ATP-binding protein n=1 Tax=Phycicoccus sp. Root563 TaxID=1736562 RepID=UPI001F19B8B8
RFARLEESRERDSGGSGLGLAIVRTIVEAHGGVVRATETPDGQCRFEARIPVVPAPVTAEATEPVTGAFRQTPP